MLYSILKDDEPKNTVNKIKKIIDNLGLNLKEDFFIDKDKKAPVSLRLSLKNNSNIGTNGKGTCKENALASAYAEFIERLQNLILFPNIWNYTDIIPDKFDVKTNIKYGNENIKKYFSKKLSVYKQIKDMDGNFDKLFLCPYYSVKEQKVYNLPFNILSRLKGSNGMAAGNTIEEAIVQGLSELCERYSLKKVLINGISLPDIPSDVYLKYDTIKNIINYFENNGFKIHIKDASLNSKVPVVCTIIEDIENNIFCPSFGAHPSLPIAIERTLTEFTQGVMLSKLKECNFIGYQCYSKEKLKYTSSQNIYQSLCLYKIAFEKTKKLEQIFFNTNPVYEFSENTWILDGYHCSNEEMLYFLKKKILEITDDIYIRNVSFLGFPSVDIFIPYMSEIMDKYNKKNIYKRNIDRFWTAYNNNPNKESYNLNSLLELSEIYSFTENLGSKKIFNVPYEYIALLCSLVIKDGRRVIKYIKIIFAQNKLLNYYTSNQLLTLKIIKDYYTYRKKSVIENSIIEKLKKKYKKSDIDYAIGVINELTFDMVLDIVIKKEKIKMLNNKKFFNRLANLYRKNLPSQIELKNIL